MLPGSRSSSLSRSLPLAARALSPASSLMESKRLEGLHSFSSMPGPQEVGRFKPSIPVQLHNINRAVMDDCVMRRELDPDVFKKFEAAKNTGAELDKPTKKAIAKSVRDWATRHGAVGYTHWFSPIRGPQAGTKLETFLSVDFGSTPHKTVIDLSPGELFQTETDGSSFPNGGLRVTHAAAAFMGWDMSSPPFIYGDHLFLPSVFVSHTGEALDLKTPLLRANDAVNTQSLRVLKHLGDKKAKKVVTNVGWEQEFFIIDREHFNKRPDLVATGRTLFGSPMSKGQSLSENYFAKIPSRVDAFLRDCRDKFWELGITADCFHNEVAPGQHEFAPIFTATSPASDQNVLAMDVMKDVAFEHDLAVLFHEKPFAGINGSGKHNNWGLNLDTGDNLFVAGGSKAEQRRFVTFVTALLATVKKHGDLLRIGVSTSGNDFRLGAQEAPPAIFTLYVGQGLEQHLRSAAEGGPLDGYAPSDRHIPVATTVQPIKANDEDRNRTAPFPWCTNRFEFRAVGSNQNISLPLSLLTSAMASTLREMADEMDKGKDVDTVVREVLKENGGALFSGNGYDSELLHSIAQKHNLFHLKTSPEAYAQLTSPKNVALLSEEGVFSEREVQARQNILNETFATEVSIEANTALKMLRQQIIPAVLKDHKQETESGFKSAGLTAKTREIENLLKSTDALEGVLDNVPDGSEAEVAAYFQEAVRPAMTACRTHADWLEKHCSEWPFASYDEILRSHH